MRTAISAGPTWAGDEGTVNRLVEGFAACIGVQNSGVEDGSVQGAEN